MNHGGLKCRLFALAGSLFALACAHPHTARAQGPPGEVQGSPADLISLFEIGGGLVDDLNGDGVADFVSAALLLGDSPSATVLAAAAEISARLGFETTAMDLPLVRAETRADGSGGATVVVGRAALDRSGLRNAGVDPLSLDPGEGSVSVREEAGRIWVIVAGGDEEGLLAAARLFSGVLPHARNLSGPDLDVRDDLAGLLESGGVPQPEGNQPDVRLTQARARSGEEGISLLVADVFVSEDELELAADAIRSLAEPSGPELEEARAGDTEPETAEATDTEKGADAFGEFLDYRGLGSVAVRLHAVDPGDAGDILRSRPGPVIRLAGTAPPPRPGPVAGRPGAGGKQSLDLSNLYTSDGLLGGGAIPGRTDALLAAGDSGSSGLPDLAARMGLESTGIVVPLATSAAKVEQPGSLPTLVLTGAVNSNPLTRELADSSKLATADLEPGQGLIELVPEAFGGKSALAVTGHDARGAERALSQVARVFPNLGPRGDDRPTVDYVENELWHALSGHSPIGQAAIGLYKLDKIIQRLAADEAADDSAGGPARAKVLMSVEKADPGLGNYVTARAAAGLELDPANVETVIDNRDVQRARTIFAEDSMFLWEVDRFWGLFRSEVLPHASTGEAIAVHARLSEPPELRRQIADQARQALIEAGADPDGTIVEIASAFKQGFYWLRESVGPRVAELIEHGNLVDEIVVRFRRNEPPAGWPQQAIHTPVRWLHEIFPIDEVLVGDLALDSGQVRFEQTHEGPTYEVVVTDSSGDAILTDSFDPRWVLRPYVDRFQDYEQVRVTTGWLYAEAAAPGGSEDGPRVLVDERIPTDPETFWDHYQGTVLPAIYDYVMRLHEGLPLGGSADAPYFGELTVQLEMSEPDYRLGVDNEIHSTMDALHEEVYFGTIEFFDLIGRNSRGQGLTFPGRILPVMTPAAEAAPPQLNLSFTGFATSRPSVVVTVGAEPGGTDDSVTVRLDIPRTALQRPSARMAKVTAGKTGLDLLALRVRVDTDADMRDSLLDHARAEAVDRSMVSAQQIEATVHEMSALREAGLYRAELAFEGLGEIEVWAETTHEQDPEARRTARLAANGTPPAPPDWRSLLGGDHAYNGQRLVQWDTPIPPGEGHRILAEMAAAFDEATMYRLGHSYLGKDIWAMDLMSPVSASHFSRAKASVHKPTVIYSARQHANEVSSTSHVLRHAELLLTDPDWRPKLDRVNVIIHPFTNPDGAQLAYDLFRETPDYILHAGYLGPLGQDVTSGGSDDHPIYPESALRGKLWDLWTPDIFLNPHGYPSHQVVQLFSEYTGLVRRGRVTERNWGFNKGWFMPGFGYIDNPEYPRHKDAAFQIRDYITTAINADSAVFSLNQRSYDRYRRYGADFDPEVFRLPMSDSVLIHMPLKGSTGGGGGGRFDPSITIWSGTTEAPDETAYGPWLELVATAGLAWDQAILDYLHDGDHEVTRSGSSFFGGVSLRLNRARPPEKPEESESTEETDENSNRGDT